MSEKEETTAYNQSAGLVKVHGVISIVLGALGVLFGLLLCIASSILPSLGDNEFSTLGGVVLGFIIFIFVVIPHVYFIVSGIYLIRQPSPRLVKGFVIGNLILGLLYGNVIILVFAIINLIQASAYERGYDNPS
ncbi:MAG: hypothetical protein JWN33_429 [Candidatus Saccharibacteria bacterium]|nr:hypothetical protein [Candidatus Saccharibacteria bacterium]